MKEYVLYGRRGSGSACIEAAMAEAGLGFRFVEVPRDPDSPGMRELIALNPRGQVPVLVLPDGTVGAESVAILLHIADAFPAARLAPPPGTAARLAHDRWLHFLLANVYEGELRWHYAARYTTDPGGAAGVKAAAEDYVHRHYAILERAVAAGDVPAGDPVNLVEIYLWMLANWHDLSRLAPYPRLAGIVARVAARPAIAAIHRMNHPENC